jgi:hypothetical protein
MLVSINSSFFFKNYTFITYLFFKYFKNNLNYFFFKKIKLNNYFIIKNKLLNNYYYYFKNIIKINNFFFIKCINLILYTYIYNYINIIYFLTKNNYNFYFISEYKNYNIFYIFDIKYLKKNLTKANFMRFLINFFKKNKIKLLIFVDFFFINFLTFFKKLGLLSSGILDITCKINYYNFPIFFQHSNIYNIFFLYNLTYDVYMLGLLHKYLNILCGFYKNYFKLNKIIYLI